mmetsp:Transcript_8559/g.25205  ORF Transcript_8559/g.25205 Transcript_8559/m.25205 type:complete len:616 (-) Transcript_8559:1118-2965(-)
MHAPAKLDRLGEWRPVVREDGGRARSRVGDDALDARIDESVYIPDGDDIGLVHGCDDGVPQQRPPALNGGVHLRACHELLHRAGGELAVVPKDLRHEARRQVSERAQRYLASLLTRPLQADDPEAPQRAEEAATHHVPVVRGAQVDEKARAPHKQLLHGAREHLSREDEVCTVCELAHEAHGHEELEAQAGDGHDAQHHHRLEEALDPQHHHPEASHGSKGATGRVHVAVHARHLAHEGPGREEDAEEHQCRVHDKQHLEHAVVLVQGQGDEEPSLHEVEQDLVGLRGHRPKGGVGEDLELGKLGDGLHDAGHEEAGVHLDLVPGPQPRGIRHVAVEGEEDKEVEGGEVEDEDAHVAGKHVVPAVHRAVLLGVAQARLPVHAREGAPALLLGQVNDHLALHGHHLADAVMVPEDLVPVVVVDARLLLGQRALHGRPLGAEPGEVVVEKVLVERPHVVAHVGARVHSLGGHGVVGVVRGHVHVRLPLARLGRAQAYRGSFGADTRAHEARWGVALTEVVRGACQGTVVGHLRPPARAPAALGPSAVAGDALGAVRHARPGRVRPGRLLHHLHHTWKGRAPAHADATRRLRVAPPPQRLRALCGRAVARRARAWDGA